MRRSAAAGLFVSLAHPKQQSATACLVVELERHLALSTECEAQSGNNSELSKKLAELSAENADAHML